MDVGTLLTGAAHATKSVATEAAQSENLQNKAASVLGMLFPYAGLEKKALDMYLKSIDESDMSPESKLMATLNAKKYIKHIKNQSKVVEIALNNAPEGTDFTEKSGVDEELIERYMDSAGYVSEEKMQYVWGQILSNEFVNPGSTPKNMSRILTEMTPEYAQAFRKLCSMKVVLLSIDETTHKPVSAIDQLIIPYSGNEDLFRMLGITLELMNELESFGLIKFNVASGYVTQGLSDHVITIIGDEIELYQKKIDNEFPIGNVLFTAAGQCLQKITDHVPIENYSVMIKKLFSRSLEKIDNHGYEVKVDGDIYNVFWEDKKVD